jgi:hypothetical protein
MRLTSIAFPDRPLVVRVPGAELVSRTGLILFVAAIAAVGGFLLVPQVGDLVTDVRLAGKAVPVLGGHADGHCTSHRGVLTECEATLTAGRPRRTVHYFFVDLHVGDYQVRVLADPAQPELLTTDLALDHLWNRALTFGLVAPMFALFVFGLAFATGKELRLQRATARALSNQVLRPVLLRMTSYTLGSWVVAPAGGEQRSWRVSRRARPIVMDAERRLILGVTAGDGAFTVPLDRALRWIRVDERERQALLVALGPLGSPAALDSPVRAAERKRWRKVVDDLGGRVSMRSPVHLVLHRREELLREVGVGLVVDARRVDVEDLLIEAPLGCADVPNPLEQLVEVVGVAWTGRVLQPLVIHREALDQVLGQTRVGPFAELCAAMAANAEANGEDRVQRVMLDRPPNLAPPLGSNHQVRLDSCLRVELPLLV